MTISNTQLSASEIRTVCSDCLFFNGETNCLYHDRLNRYINKGIKLDREEDKTLINTLCPAARSKDFKPNLSFDKKIELVDKKLFLTFDTIILEKLRDPPYKSLIKILHTAKSLWNGDIKPKNIVVVIRNSYVNKQKILIKLMSFLNKKCPKGCKFHLIQELQCTNFRHSWKTGFKKCSSYYYTFCWAGYQYGKDYLSNFNKLINEDLEKIVMCIGDRRLNGTIVSKLAHKLFCTKYSANTVVAIINKEAIYQGLKNCIINQQKILT